MQIKLKDETILKCIEFNPGINGASEVMFVLEGKYSEVESSLTKDNLSYFEKINDDNTVEILSGYDKIINLTSKLNVEDRSKSIIVVSLQLTSVADTITLLKDENKAMKKQMDLMLIAMEELTKATSSAS